MNCSRAGLDPAGAVISAAELVVRINLVRVVDDECVPNEEELMVAMGCACGLHSDTHDVDRHELIVYLHAHPASSMSSSTLDALPRIGLASVACSAAVIEFTVPQIVKLSQTSGQPLPPAPLPIRL